MIRIRDIQCRCLKIRLSRPTAIAHKGAKIVAIWQHNKRVFGLFSLRMRRKAYLRASDQKSDPTIRSGDLDFL